MTRLARYNDLTCTDGVKIMDLIRSLRAVSSRALTLSLLTCSFASTLMPTAVQAREVGVQWVNDYPDPADDRSYWDDSASDFGSELSSKGLGYIFNYGNGNLYERSYRRSDYAGYYDVNGTWVVDSSGTDSSYVDAVDWAYIGAHGMSAGGRVFVEVDPTLRSYDVDYNYVYNMNLKWGNADLEWFVMDSCSQLCRDADTSDRDNDGNVTEGKWTLYKTSFVGLHAIIGYESIMWVSANNATAKKKFVDYAYASSGTKRSIYEAWSKANDAYLNDLAYSYMIPATSSSDKSFFDEKVGAAKADLNSPSYYWLRTVELGTPTY